MVWPRASANLTANPFASVTTVTAQIVKLRPATRNRQRQDAHGLRARPRLFIVTLLLNIVACTSSKVSRSL